MQKDIGAKCMHVGVICAAEHRRRWQ